MTRESIGILVAAALLLFDARSAPAEAPSLEAFLSDPMLTHARISPSGNHIAAILSVEGQEMILVWDVRTNQKQPILRFPDEELQIQWLNWANDHRILFGVVVAQDISVARRRTELYGVDRDGSDLKNMAYAWDKGLRRTLVRDRVIGLMPDAQKYVAIQVRSSAFRMDVGSGRLKPLYGDKNRVGRWYTDRSGAVRLGVGRSQKTMKYSYFARQTAKTGFDEIYGFDWESEPAFWFLGFDEQDPSRIFVTSNHASDRLELYTFDIEKKSFAKKIFGHSQFDVDGPLVWDPTATRVVGVRYEDDEPRVHYFDAAAARLQGRIDRALPGSHNFIIDASYGGERILVQSSSDTRVPRTHLYLPEDDQMLELFKAYPELPDEALSPMRSVAYVARDGRRIHGYLTVPRDAEPVALPVVVHPHGGPSSRNYRGFDREVQFLASRGYAVFQMNFRGSTGYGSEHYRAGFHQWGGTMQDDITDGVRWLIEQGIADPDRIAIYGASYGGYAALMGLVKTPELFRCGASYAGVTDLEAMVKGDRWWYGSEELNTHTIGHRSADLAKLKATSPINRVDEIRVPVLLVHGSDDAVVKPEHSERMAKALEKADKKHYLRVFRHGLHGFNVESDRLQFYAGFERFLANNMKPRAPRSSEAGGS